MNLEVSSPTRTSPAPIPSILAGRYRIEHMLGGGGMGVVYQARDLLHEQFGSPDPHVAVKLLSESISGATDGDILLHSEFLLTRQLHHPHVIRAHSFEVDTACCRAFMTLELLRGLTLDRLLCERPQGLPWRELQDIAVDLLDALAHSHERGVLHGDLKPSNVILAEDGLRLFDFGLGQATTGALSTLPSISRDRVNAWTPGYAAPEVLDGQPLSMAADVYSMACVLYELAAGKAPFLPLNALQAREQKRHRTLSKPHSLPKQCWPALHKALALKPRVRRVDVRQLREAFRTAPRAQSWLWF